VKRYRVEFSPAASRHAEQAHNWWRANRPAATLLFRRELAVAIRQLTRSPASSAAYEHPDAPVMRRLLLPRTRYHVYFVVDEPGRVVRIHAGWHASRGSGPG